ncbi:uncharacterized protein LOC114444918 [Parambassis ranga]|uniref:Uncharacterized protein LOC114444917 n=1 Tax=Parambassis ranga TaxID=210632 RepID=A0A6P7JIZ4_9TELE|nr:uncharacterized protein LOC114444917 [Parambassis ranga]XP_028275617.1 uncharacterized protein LOC114444918 [Parambassis ranga]
MRRSTFLFPVNKGRIRRILHNLPDLSDAILLSMQRSRRLLFVLSPDFLVEKSFSLLECRLGLYLQHGCRASIVAVVFRSVSKLPYVEVAQLRQATVSSITWRGSRSGPRRSRFWLRLRLALPVRPLALGRRLIDSTSSHSDLAALALQRAQRIQNDRANQSRRNRRTSANQIHRDRRGVARGRGSIKSQVTCREEGPPHGQSCRGCAGFVGQVEDRGVELTAETEVQPEPDSTHNSDPAPNTDPALHTGQQAGQVTVEGVTSPTRVEELAVKIPLTPPLKTNPAPFKRPQLSL